jgi:RHS repeat-associated protein
VFSDGSWNVPAGDGEVITYTYDKGGMIDKISGKLTPTATAENYLNDVGYDDFGSRANLVLGNGINTKYTYSPERHFLSGVTASGKATSGTVQFANYTYTYDPVGNIRTIANNPPQSAIQAPGTVVGVGPLLITNTYDEIDRLTSSTGKYRGHTTYGHEYSSTFRYDTIDNLIEKHQTDTRLNFSAGAQGLQGGTPGPVVVPTTYSLNYKYVRSKPPHQPESITETNAGTITPRPMQFDANGNRTVDSIGSTTRTMAWDEADRLRSVTEGTSTKGEFRYNPDGERTQKRDTSNATTFYFNQFLVIDGSRRMTKHLFAGETRIASKTGAFGATTVRSFYHPDHIGSTSYVSDASQNLVQHERYFPFGERWWESGLDETTGAARDYLFTGKELDRSTGFYYFGKRYFDPRMSNWLSTDPILASYVQGEENGGVFDPGNLGLYTYSYNNPIVIRDPDGLQGVPAQPAQPARPATRIPRPDILNPYLQQVGAEGTNPPPGLGRVEFRNERAARIEETRRVVAGGRLVEPSASVGSTPGATIGPARGAEPIGRSAAESEARASLPDELLVRRGRDPESATRLGKQAHEAECSGCATNGVEYGHGVSVTSPASNARLSNDPSDASMATRQAFEDAGFPVRYTPTKKDRNHHTVQLPKPVTPTDAIKFNNVLGRSKK